MAKKKGFKKRGRDEVDKFEKRVKKFGKEVEDFDDEIDREVKEVEEWILQRRKFFIKLAIVVGAVIVLMLILKFLI